MPLEADVETRGACEVDTLTVGPFQSNCYLVRAGEGQPAVVIDPGDEAERILARLERWGGDLAAILLTHAHLDHVGAVAAVARETGAPIHLHPGDRFLYDDVETHARMYGTAIEAPPPPDVDLRDGDELTFGELRWTVRHSPGHSPGGVVFAGSGGAFVGDSLFAGSIGRTDLPGGDPRQLLASIRRQILTLAPDTVLYPGHMGPTTVAHEASTNPFLISGGFGGYA